MTRCTIPGNDSAIRCGDCAIRWSHCTAPRRDSAIPWNDSSAPYHRRPVRGSPDLWPKGGLHGTVQPFCGIAESFTVSRSHSAVSCNRPTVPYQG
jgi:hypothetical protein